MDGVLRSNDRNHGRTLHFGIESTIRLTNQGRQSVENESNFLFGNLRLINVESATIQELNHCGSNGSDVAFRVDRIPGFTSGGAEDRLS